MTEAVVNSKPFQWTAKFLAKFGLSGRGLVIAVPTLWLLVFFLIPFIVVLKISFAEAMIARPPYSKLIEPTDSGFAINFSFLSYQYLVEDGLYLAAYGSSLRIAFFSTLFALLIGYPMAYFIARSSGQWRNILLMLVIMPFWTSFLLRVYAWIGILKGNGYINNLLLSLGIINEPLVMMQTDFAVYVGIVYTYLPFMILPLYANLVKLDGSLLEASSDLGAKPIMTFLTITLPLSLPGILAGCMLVFIPVVGEFVIPALLGGPDTNMIGRVLWDEFFRNRDWPTASAVAIIMLLVLVLPIMLLQKAQDGQNQDKSGI
ncbi:ABC transporter permease subunit [Maritalea porphyrae]|uniref:Putrescine ABC transporter permease n=1 Tax=Maritalea porphyrae TaxID=880732 RepID=A0ABQ5UT77_9HYPH|nr:ABC transporter permease subunit [Maritalea porphyrae]GLQ18316.1 putrescine ABC transporter permease [Maritalea porphyrae]